MSAPARSPPAPTFPPPRGLRAPLPAPPSSRSPITVRPASPTLRLAVSVFEVVRACSHGMENASVLETKRVQSILPVFYVASHTFVLELEVPCCILKCEYPHFASCTNAACHVLIFLRGEEGKGQDRIVLNKGLFKYLKAIRSGGSGKSPTYASFLRKC